MQNGPEKKTATVRKNDLPVPANLRRERPLWPVIQQLLQALQPPPSSHRFGSGRVFGSTWVGQHYWAQEIAGLSIEAGAGNGYQRYASHIKTRAFGSARTRRRRWLQRRLWRDQIWSWASQMWFFRVRYRLRCRQVYAPRRRVRRRGGCRDRRRVVAHTS